MRILFYGESPVITTGLAQVTRTIVDALTADGHQVEIVGTNHHGVESFDQKVFPYKMTPLIDDKDPHAIETAVERVKDYDSYDCVFVSTDFGRDMHIYDALGEHRHEKLVVGYYAVDCDVLNAQTFNSLCYCNAKITYTQHGRSVIEKFRPDMRGLINIIPLACEPDVFYPFPQEERHQARKDIFYTEDNSKFIVINVNRNQPRKDLGRSLMIFHEFHNLHPNSLLYIHACQEDLGGHLPTMAMMLGMELGSEVLFSSEDLHMLRGFTREYLNRVYNAADCLVSTSLGEGWGLATTEAMAAMCPVIVPRNTAFMEIVGEKEERGYLCDTGGSIDHLTWLYGNTNHPHDIVHAQSMIDKLEHVYYNMDEASCKAADAREWTLSLTKEDVGRMWSKFFREVEPMLPQILGAKHEL